MHTVNIIFVSASENLDQDCRLYHLYKTVLSEGSSSSSEVRSVKYDLACRRSVQAKESSELRGTSTFCEKVKKLIDIVLCCRYLSDNQLKSLPRGIFDHNEGLWEL